MHGSTSLRLVSQQARFNYARHLFDPGATEAVTPARPVTVEVA